MALVLSCAKIALEPITKNVSNEIQINTTQFMENQVLFLTQYRGIGDGNECSYYYFFIPAK